MTGRFHIAQEAGRDVGKNAKMTVSANQSCPFAYFFLHRPRLPSFLRGIKSANGVLLFSSVNIRGYENSVQILSVCVESIKINYWLKKWGSDFFGFKIWGS